MSDGPPSPEPTGLAPAPGVDPTSVIKGQQYAVGPEPVWFCDLGPDADRWQRAKVHIGDVIVADYVDEHGNVMAAGIWTLVHTRSLLSLDDATAQDTATIRSWQHHRTRLQKAAAEVLAILACADCGHSRDDHDTGHQTNGCTALAGGGVDHCLQWVCGALSNPSPSIGSRRPP